MIWSLIECAVGIISCCLPTLRSLLVLAFGRLATTRYGSAMFTMGSSGSKRFRHTVSGNSRSSRNGGTLPKGTMMNSIERNQSDHGLGDEVQLTGIHVRTEIEWSEDSRGAAPSPPPSETATVVHSA